jgi:hypothetical protein
MQQEEQKKEVVKAARAKVQQLSAQGEVELELAKEFIRESAYWDHPSGSLPLSTSFIRVFGKS